MGDTSKNDIAFIEALAEVLTKGDLGEIEVERQFGSDDTIKIRIAKPKSVQAAPVAAAPAPAPAAAPAAPAPAPAAPEEPTAAPEDPASLTGAITSPMVGTVYLQPEPGRPPFVSVGDTVTEGQTLLIIEAMKTMNHIPAPRAGKVTRILVDDSAPVEYGAPLIVIS